MLSPTSWRLERGSRNNQLCGSPPHLWPPGPSGCASHTSPRCNNCWPRWSSPAGRELLGGGGPVPFVSCPWCPAQVGGIRGMAGGKWHSRPVPAGLPGPVASTPAPLNDLTSIRDGPAPLGFPKPACGICSSQQERSVAGSPLLPTPAGDSWCLGAALPCRLVELGVSGPSELAFVFF